MKYTQIVVWLEITRNEDLIRNTPSKHYALQLNVGLAKLRWCCAIDAEIWRETKLSFSTRLSKKEIPRIKAEKRNPLILTLHSTKFSDPWLQPYPQLNHHGNCSLPCWWLMLLVIRITLKGVSGTRYNVLKTLLDDVQIILLDQWQLIASLQILRYSFSLSDKPLASYESDFQVHVHWSIYRMLEHHRWYERS